MASTLKEYDICIVGSGAAGGVMAKELSEGGAQVVLLEGGKGSILRNSSPIHGLMTCNFAACGAKSRRCFTRVM